MCQFHPEGMNGIQEISLFPLVALTRKSPSSLSIICNPQLCCSTFYFSDVDSSVQRNLAFEEPE